MLVKTRLGFAYCIALSFLICFGLLMLNSTQVLFPTINAVQPPIPSGTNSSSYASLQALHLRQMTGQTVILGFGTTGSNSLAIDTETQSTGACSPTTSTAALASVLSVYTTNLLATPVTEGSTNSYTPACAWTQGQADASYLSYGANTYLPGDYVFQNSKYWIASCPLATGIDATCTAAGGQTFIGAGPFTDGNVTWTVSSVSSGTHAPPLDGYCGSSYICGPAGSDCYSANANTAIVININSLGPCNITQLRQSQPIPSELPIRMWMQTMQSTLTTYLNGISFKGYVRFGLEGGEIGLIGVNSGLWPNYSTLNCTTTACKKQQKAVALSYVKIFDTYISNLGASFLILSDMHCAGNPVDCGYADQEAQLAHDLNFGLDTNGYGVEDYKNITHTTLNGSAPATPCSFPLTAANGCTSGDWLYNCSRFPTMQNGNAMWCSLQTVAASNPNGCVALTTGSLAPLNSMTNCSTGFIGLMHFLVVLRTTGVPGVTPAVVVNVNNVEIYVNPPASCSPSISTCVTNGTYGAGDMFLALYSNYLSTTNSQATFAPYAPAYLSAFNEYLGIVPRLTLVGVGE